jgi:type VI secretion system secreted protein VgrG
MPMQRSVNVKTALGDALTFHHMTGSEAISRPFVFELALVSEDMTLALEDVLGTPVTVTLELDHGAKRYFHGLASDFAYTGTENELACYRATIRPWLWFLVRTYDCRIFQNQTAVEIIKTIFGKYPIAEFEDRLTGHYPRRVYCVQYRESDFDFVSRLMESEGIYYFFNHEDDRHTLVLADSPQAHENFANYAEVPFFPRDDLARRERDHVYEWQVRSIVESGAYLHTAFDFEKPKADLAAKRAQPMPHALASGEVYDYPGPHVDLGEGDRVARLRLEASQVGHKRVSGAGTAAGLASGHTFRLTQYPRADQNAEHLLLEVAHEIWEPTYRTAMSGEAEHYLCSFEAMPAKVTFRPPRVTAKPIVQGPQTAIVTGPSGEEIWPDKYGRVKVQFHWDRLGKHDESSSCWVRVSQLWAGSSFGGIHIPRIGQEVIVDFLEGDPDCPLITGRVYNGMAMPPYVLPANATQSGIKSNSSKGGGGSNELMFEDKKSSELVYLHAQKDESIVVENDKSERVGHDETIAIGNDRTETVGRNETLTVGNDRTRNVVANEAVAIGGNQTVTVSGNRVDTVTLNEARTVLIAQQQTVGAARNVTVGASQSHEVGISDAWAVGVDRNTAIGVNDSLTVGGDRSANVDQNDSLDVGKDRSASINDNDTLKVGKTLTVTAGDEISITTGKASIVMKKDGTITINGKDITIDGSGKINAKASSTITMKGEKILQN